MLGQNLISNIFQTQMLYIYHQQQNKILNLMANDLLSQVLVLSDVFAIFLQYCLCSQRNIRLYILNYICNT